MTDRVALPLAIVVFVLVFLSSSEATAILAGDVTGPPDDNTVVAIQGKAVPASGSAFQCLGLSSPNADAHAYFDCGAGEGLENGWVTFSDGTTTANASGADTFTFAQVSPASISIDGKTLTIGLNENAITITEAQISDLGAYAEAFLELADTPGTYASAGGHCVRVNSAANALEFTECPTNGGGNGATELDELDDVTITSPADNHLLRYDFGLGHWVNVPTASLTLDAAQITTGTFADARVAESNVTQHEAALSITESQISDLGNYIEEGNVSIETDTDLEAGRGLTLTGATISADEPLYTVSFSMHWPLATTTDDDNPQWLAPHALTITRVDCSTNTGTVTIQLEQRSLTTPNSSGTDILTSELVCDSDNESTTSFSNAAIAQNALVSLTVTGVSGSPTMTRIHVRGTYDD